MKYTALIFAFLLAGCVLPTPRPSMWQLESDCAAVHQFIEVPTCTRQALDSQYSTWHAAPQANEFVDFIGATAERVREGVMSEADARLTVSQFASQQSALLQALNQQQQAAQLQAGLQLLQQANPPPAPLPLPTTCVSRGNSSFGTVTTTCQ